MSGTVYLLHFERPFGHARHYMGFTVRQDLEHRLEEHRTGRGARLMEAVTEAGISFVLARTWEGSRTRERQLKENGGYGRLCPICRAAGGGTFRTYARKQVNGSGQRGAAVYYPEKLRTTE